LQSDLSYFDDEEDDMATSDVSDDEMKVSNSQLMRAFVLFDAVTGQTIEVLVVRTF